MDREAIVNRNFLFALKNSLQIEIEVEHVESDHHFRKIKVLDFHVFYDVWDVLKNSID